MKYGNRLRVHGSRFACAGVKILDEICECGASMLKVEFRENQNKEPIEGCILDDEEMVMLLETRCVCRGSCLIELVANLLSQLQIRAAQCEGFQKWRTRSRAWEG